MLKTGYFWKATHEPDPNVTYVSISRQKQQGAEHIATYELLIPSWDIIRMAHEMGYSKESFMRYKDAYYEQLSRLNARQVYEDLKKTVP